MKTRNRHRGSPSHVPAGSRTGRKALAWFLSAAMCLSMLPDVAQAASGTAAPTDEYGFELSEPDSFDANDGNHPLGRGSNVKGNLNPTKELSILTSFGSSTYDYDESTILKNLFSASYPVQMILGLSSMSPVSGASVSADSSPLRYVSAVAYDPDGSGRDDTVAYYGAARASGNQDYQMRLYQFKGNSGKFNDSSIMYRGSTTDSYRWMSKLNAYTADGYTAITAGDFDGTGKETLVYYDPAWDDLKLLENSGDMVLDLGNNKTLKGYFGKTLNEIQALGESLQKVANDTALVQLEAADLDGNKDNKDELIVTVSLGNLDGENSDITERASVVMVLSKNGKGSWETVWSYQFRHVVADDQPTNKYDAGWHLRAAASRADDIDGDGEMEIITAGVGSDDNNNDDNFHDEGYFAVVTECDGGSYQVGTTTQTFNNKTVSCQSGIYVKQSGESNKNWVGEKDDHLQYMNPCSLGIVRFDGRGTVPYIVIRGQIFQYDDLSGTLTGADTKTNTQDYILSDRKIIRQPVVGNFDGNAAGREQIMFAMTNEDDEVALIGGYYYKPSDYVSSEGTGKYQSTRTGKSAIDDADGDEGKGLRSCIWGVADQSLSELALAASDVDDDGIIAEYTGKEYAFNDPQVLAIMEAPPFFEDIDYNDPGETSISFSKGSGSSTGSSTANRIGAYVSYEQDFSLFGVTDLGGIEFEAAFEAEWNKSIEEEQTFTMTNSFSAEQGESAVVMICIPVTVYHYNTTAADGSKTTMDVTVADAPVYKTLSLTEYNEAAALRGDPEIGSDIIASTAGQPSTYRSTATGLTNAVTTSTGWFDLAAGEGTKSQSVAFDTSKTTTRELTYNVDAKAGGGAAGFKLGVSGGYSTGSSVSSISTEGIERSGTVHDVPTGTTGYGFQWQFVGWETTMTTGGSAYSVPVLSYLVRNVKQLPSKPQNLEATEVTTESITLEWESGFTTAAQYQVYRYMPSNTSGTQYALLGTVSGLSADEDGRYTLTDTEVQPGTEYQYVIQSVGTDGKSSDYNEVLAVTTLSDGYMPKITKQPEDTSVRLGTDASFSISAQPTGKAKSVAYRWQSREEGGRWTDLNQNGPVLTIESPAKSMSGTEYRCIVSQTDLTTQTSAVVYSDTATLTVGKADSKTALASARSGGRATYETAGEARKAVTAQYDITYNGDTSSYQKYENIYTGVDRLEDDVYGSSGGSSYQYYRMDQTLSLGAADANGVYSGTVSGKPEVLTSAADRVTVGGKVYEIGENGFKKTQQTETIAGTEYKVYTAIAAAGTAGIADTLTLYYADGKYYRRSGDSVGDALIEMTGKNSISDTDTNAYRTDSLAVSYAADSNGYAILTYTPAGTADALEIYELDGSYYSKNNGSYNSLAVVKGLYKTSDGKLFKPGTARTTEITVADSKNQVVGDTVRLTATVNTPNDASAAANGTVTFEITNTSTGNITRYAASKSSDDSTVYCDWIPVEAGVYSIAAVFSGNSETATSRSDAITYYAQTTEALYEIAVNDCAYGDTIAPGLRSVTISDTEVSTSDAGRAVTYSAFRSDWPDEATGWSYGQTLVPGTYQITATENGKIIASKYITVGKKQIDITAPPEKNKGITFESFVNGDDYSDIFTTEGMPTDDTAGIYNVSVVYNEEADDFEARQAEFLSRYTSALHASTVALESDTYTVTYSHGNNGELKGYQGSYSTLFSSGTAVASGSNVTFTAAPAENYRVWRWTVNGSEVSADNEKYTLSADKTTLTVSSLQEELDVRVEFSNQFYTVSAQSDANGSVAAAADGSILASDSVLSGTEVVFTAAPKDGYVVKQWTVTRGTGAAEILKNTDGSNFSGRELKLTIAADTAVNVTFEKAAMYTVHYAAVEQTDTDKSVALNFETTGLTDGKGEKSCAVTLTAKPSSAMGIAGWQYKTSENGDWVTSGVTGLSYTIQNLQSDMWVRALVNNNAAPTAVAFDIVDESGKPVAGGGTLTAKYAANDEAIASGTGCITYSTIVFTYEEPAAYEAVGWRMNGSDVTADRSGKTFTYTIDSLTTKTAVNMVVRAKPLVTVEAPENGSLTAVYTLNNETVTPEKDDSGNQYVYSGTLSTLTAVPDENYVVTAVTARLSTGNTSSLENIAKENGTRVLQEVRITANAVFSAVFAEKPVVTVNTVENGTVSVNGTVNGKADTELKTGDHVDFGKAITVTLIPDTGYEVGAISGADPAYTDGDGSTTDEKFYTMSNVNESQTITPVWVKIPTVAISWSVIDKTPGTDGGTNGSLTATVTRKGMSSYAVTASETGELAVYRDSVVSFTATPDSGYKTGVWQLNGSRQDSKPELAVTNDMSTPQAVQVQFDPLGDQVTYSFKPDSAASGAHKAQLSAAFTANGSSRAADFASGTTPATGGSITFAVSDLDNGYEVEGWYVNGEKQAGEAGLTFTSSVVRGNGMDVQVKIIRKSYTVTFSCDNGTVEAMADGALESGGSVVGDTSVTFTASPGSDSGYTFAGWTVNGEPIEEKGAELTLSITGDTVVSAAYTLNSASYAVSFGAVTEGGDAEYGTLTAARGTDKLTSGAEQAAGSRIVFTAEPKDGYRVKGWYTDASGGTEITGTAAEQNIYTIENLTGEANVYVAFEPVPAYEIIVSTTGFGHVTASVNGTDVDIAEGSLTVSCHDDVVLTAVPDENQYLTGWTLDGRDKGNSSMTLSLEDVTEAHAVAAEFAESQLVTLKTVCGAGGVLTAEAGYGDSLQTIDASSESGIQIEKGKKLVLTADPNENYMIEKWIVNGIVQDNLSNTLTIDNLSESTTIEVTFEAPAVLYEITESGTGYTVTDIQKLESEYGSAMEIRKNGTVTFTVAPEGGGTFTTLKVNGMECLTAEGTADSENRLTVQNNQDGSYTVTVANVTKNIEIEAESLKLRVVKEALSDVPSELTDVYDTLAALQTALRAQISKSNARVSAGSILYYDIELQYSTDGGATWISAEQEDFPAGGITVEIPYSELGSGLESSYSYTVAHMLTNAADGHEAGETESITPVNGADGISFTVSSMSPFAIGWYKASGGSGGGGGGSAAPASYTITVPSIDNGNISVSAKAASSGERVTLTVTPDSGYELDSIAVKAAGGSMVAVTKLSDTEYTFTMPSSGVTISAEFSTSEGGFTDVASGSYYKAAVDWAVENGITAGTSDTRFSPDDICTRAQAVTFLWRAAGSPAPTSAAMHFTDVPDSAYYRDAVLWAIENGITVGTSETTFSPDMTCTRAHIVTFLHRASGTPEAAASDIFSDVAADAYYAGAVSWAVAEKITTGTSSNTFSPDNDCTRAQIVTFLYRQEK